MNLEGTALTLDAVNSSQQHFCWLSRAWVLSSRTNSDISVLLYNEIYKLLLLKNLKTYRRDCGVAELVSPLETSCCRS